MAHHSAEDRPGPDGTYHIIKYYNKNYYVIAKGGDTFKSLSKELGISVRKLAKYNERSRKDRLEAGDIIYLKKKRKKATKNYKDKFHVVKANESMYTISQEIRHTSEEPL